MGRRFQSTGLDRSVLQEPKEKSIKTSNNILEMKMDVHKNYHDNAVMCLGVRKKGIYIN